MSGRFFVKLLLHNCQKLCDARAEQLSREINMGEDLKIRVAVGNSSSRHSAVWSVFTNKNEVFATHRTMAGVEKFSFHASRHCRRAFIKTHKLPPTMTDRVLTRWMRAETPLLGEDRAIAVLTVIFPEGHLSPELPGSLKETIWLSNPSVGEARFMRIIFTNESENRLSQILNDHSIVAYHVLPNGEAVAILSWSEKFEQRTLIMESSLGVMKDLVMPSSYEAGIERPVGFTMYTQPDEMCCIELSGYWVDSGEGRRRHPAADTLSRNNIIQNGTKS